MLKVENYDKIRQAYYLEKKSIRQIAQEQGHSRKTVKKAIENAQPSPYQQQKSRQAPVLGPYKDRIAGLLEQNQQLPHKQRYTSRRIYETILTEGYQGSEISVRHYVAQLRKVHRKRRVYLPLEYEPGQDAQVDWGEAQVVYNGLRTTVQLFVMRWCYSRKVFVRAYPTQRQECFFDAHVAAFHYFSGIPQRIAYDNLKTAVYAILTGHSRQEQEQFIAFRSHYVFESRYCNPGQGHEKGGVEHGVGFTRRNFLVPLPEVSSFEELNAYLLERCQADDARTVHGQPQTIGEAWQQEQLHSRSLPRHDFTCCVSREVTLNPYSQVTFETNHYSVPADQAYPQLTLRAYPFRIEILYGDHVLAEHARSYERHQDILNPWHYLPLLERRPGAFEHAKPIRQWRKTWSEVFERLLAYLQQQHEGGRAIRHFIGILKLVQTYPPAIVIQAIEQALILGCVHRDGVELCIRQGLEPDRNVPALDLSALPQLAQVGTQPLNLTQYDQLLLGDSYDH